jgi:hypothetical protein
VSREAKCFIGKRLVRCVAKGEHPDSLHDDLEEFFVCGEPEDFIVQF